MKHLGLCLALIAVFAIPARADDLAARTAAAERYVASPAVVDMLDKMLSGDTVLKAMEQRVASLNQAQRTKLQQIISEEFQTVKPAVRTAMIETTASMFTLKEIDALAQFYSTPEGVSIMQKMQDFFPAAMNRVQPDMARMQQRLAARITKELK
ncbi:MAG: DUF2059 domain-containing protein [Pseudomonadota bacterium]